MIIDFGDWEKIHKIDLKVLAEDFKTKENFYMALSNPCFELWLLLHLKDIKSYSKEEQMKIFENKKENTSKNHIDIVLGVALENGRGYKKKPNPKIFLPKISTAIARARELANEDDAYPTSLGSDVFKLVEKLIK